MNPVRGQAQQHIAQSHIGGQGGATPHRADGETGQVEIAIVIHAGHFRRLATNQGTAGHPASPRDTFDDPRGLIDRKPAGRKIIKKEQRLGTLTDQIVHAHRDQILADRIQMPGVDGNPQLGADAIGRGHQDRIVIARGGRVEQGAKAAKRVHHTGPRGGGCRGFDPINQRVSRVDIHACIAIADPVLRHRPVPGWNVAPPDSGWRGSGQRANALDRACRPL